MEWPTQNTKAFIEIVYDRVKKGQLQGSTFKTGIWEEINTELNKITAGSLPYGVERLKEKFNRLRIQHREFSTLLSHTGVTWDSESNKVNAPQEVWDDLFTKGKFYKQFKKHGYEHEYDILSEIFNSSIATGKLSQASAQEPPNSDEETELEGDSFSKGVRIDSDSIDVDEEDFQEFGKKRKVIEFSSEHQHIEAKTSTLGLLEEALSKWMESINARTEASKAKAERYKAKATEATSPGTDPYSIDACMDLLESMDDIYPKAYNNALEKFLNKD